MDTKQLLLEFSGLSGISGRETSAHDYAKKQLEAYGEVEATATGSLLCRVKPPQTEGGIHILLDAHLDEIGMIVSYIDDNGFLKASAAGGVDERLLMASTVHIHTKNEVLLGVICSIPPHLSTGEEKNPKVEDIYIDTGLSGEAAKEKICIGDSVSFASHPTALLGDRIRGKALDDRAGCVALLKALEELGGDIDCGLTVVFSSMEEIGLQGATTAAYQVNPTHALAVDCTFGDTPDVKPQESTILGKGPVIGFSANLKQELSQQLVAIAKTEDIPFQQEVSGGRTGTNADTIVTTRAGVQTALLSIPQRFMHTPNEVVSVADVEQTSKLIAAWVRTLGKEGK